MYCRHCGESLKGYQTICLKCGTRTGKGTNYCAHCGVKVERHQIACVSCGYAIPKEKKSVRELFEAKKKPIIIVGVLIAVVVAIIIFSSIGGKGKEVDFQKIYDKYCKSTWAEVGEDKSYLSVDTNPFDRDDSGMAYYAAWEAIESINKELGLPASLTKEMLETSGADGRQTREFEDSGIEVTWKYHPDYGMEVTYKKLK